MDLKDLKIRSLEPEILNKIETIYFLLTTLL